MSKSKTYYCYFFLGSLMISIIIFYLLGLQNLFTFEMLVEHKKRLLSLIASYPVLSALFFTLIYAALTAMCVPFHTFFMLAAGYLFFYPLAIVYSIVGSTLGATVLFFIVRGSIGKLVDHYLRRRFFSFSSEISNHAANYLLFLRIARFLPVTVINLLPAFFSVSINTYMWTSIIGSIPAAIVYCHIGEFLESYLHPHAPLALKEIVGFKLQLALTLVGLISLFPVGLRHLVKILKRIKL